MSVRCLPDEVLVLVHDFLSAAQSPQVYCAVHDAGGAFRCTGTMVCDAVLRAAQAVTPEAAPPCCSVHDVVHAPLGLRGASSYAVHGVRIRGTTSECNPRRVCVRHDCCRVHDGYRWTADAPDVREQLRALEAFVAQLQGRRAVVSIQCRFSSWKALSFFTEVLETAGITLAQHTPYVTRTNPGIRVSWLRDRRTLAEWRLYHRAVVTGTQR